MVCLTVCAPPILWPARRTPARRIEGGVHPPSVEPLLPSIEPLLSTPPPTASLPSTVAALGSTPPIQRTPSVELYRPIQHPAPHLPRVPAAAAGATAGATAGAQSERAAVGLLRVPAAAGPRVAPLAALRRGGLRVAGGRRRPRLREEAQQAAHVPLQQPHVPPQLLPPTPRAHGQRAAAGRRAFRLRELGR
jgi:hypothetical protein